MSIDIIGTLWNGEGDDAVALPGYHVNLRKARPSRVPIPDLDVVDEATIAALDAWRVRPANCRVVWAGDVPTAPLETVCFRFADLDEARTQLTAVGLWPFT